MQTMEKTKPEAMKRCSKALGARTELQSTTYSRVTKMMKRINSRDYNSLSLSIVMAESFKRVEFFTIYCK